MSSADVGAISHSRFEWLRSFLRSSVGVMRLDVCPGARVSFGNAPRREPSHAAVRRSSVGVRQPAFHRSSTMDVQQVTGGRCRLRFAEVQRASKTTWAGHSPESCPATPPRRRQASRNATNDVAAGSPEGESSGRRATSGRSSFVMISSPVTCFLPVIECPTSTSQRLDDRPATSHQPSRAGVLGQTDSRPSRQREDEV
jgi:hypothetical protein